MRRVKRSIPILLAAASIACARNVPAPAVAAGPGRWELLPSGDRPLPRHENA